jgi:hypothetical protein
VAQDVSCLVHTPRWIRAKRSRVMGLPPDPFLYRTLETSPREHAAGRPAESRPEVRLGQTRTREKPQDPNAYEQGGGRIGHRRIHPEMGASTCCRDEDVISQFASDRALPD